MIVGVFFPANIPIETGPDMFLICHWTTMVVLGIEMRKVTLTETITNSSVWVV